MTYSLADFEGGDLSQYFSDTYVKYTVGETVKAGYIAGFHGSRAVIKSDSNEDVVSLSQINWSGLTKPSCITYNNQLWFIGPSGHRSYKKPPTGRNTMALTYDYQENPLLIGPGTGNGEVSDQLIRNYLIGSNSYPLDRTSISVLIEHDTRAIALTSTTGMFYNRKSEWVFVEDCIIRRRVDGWDEATDVAAEYLSNG